MPTITSAASAEINQCAFSPARPLQVLLGSYFGNSQQRRAINEARARPPPTDKAALALLNDTQKYAVQRSLAQQVLLLQGPPGTGKTQVAEAIFSIWNSAGVPGPLVGTAPSNIGADNLASRLLKTTTLKAKRYAPDKIIDENVRIYSSQQMAIENDSDPSSNSKKKRRSGGGSGRANSLPRTLML